MLVGEAINKKTHVLTTSETLSEAKRKMDDLEVRSLPVINASMDEVIGRIYRDVIEYQANSEELISSQEMDEPIIIFNNQHLFYAVRLMLQHEIEVLPVVDEQSLFLGTIQKKHLLNLLVKMLNLAGHGSVITVELRPNDFTLSEIVNLIETEGGKIMGITVESPDADHENYEISIKLNLEDATRIASALRRYDYTILTDEKAKTYADLAMRVDEFLQYIDM
jgi:CBS domain-containing protein